MSDYDAIVVGVGGMGSATVFHLARRGWRVLGLEQFDIPNEMGSSHGVTRMIRYTLQEHPSYVPLVRRAFQLWHQLENQSGERLLVTTGSLRAGSQDSTFFQGAIESCDLHHVPYEILTSAQVNQRFPGYQWPEEISTLYQSDGGFLLSERCIINHVGAALESGAEVHGREQVLGWEPDGEGVKVDTNRGSYSASRLIVTAGAWAYKMVPELAGIAVPESTMAGLSIASMSRAPSRSMARSLV